MKSASGSASRCRKRGSRKSSPCAKRCTLFRSFYRQGIEPEDGDGPRVARRERRLRGCRNLSGGQKQRLAVACALVGDPELLFLDEPTTGLDPQSRRQLWELIRGFRETGRTVLLTTHYMDEAERLCDRVAIVDQGRVMALDTPRELIASLGGDHVVEFTCETRRTATDRSTPASFADLPAVSAARDGERPRLPVGRASRTSRCRPCSRGSNRSDCQLTSLTTRHASLEDVFVKLAGRHLADATRRSD